MLSVWKYVEKIVAKYFAWIASRCEVDPVCYVIVKMENIFRQSKNLQELNQV